MNDDWYAVGPGKGMCKRCGEDRLIHKAADGRGVWHYCEVCSHKWQIRGPLTCAEYKADISGHQITGE